MFALLNLRPIQKTRLKHVITQLLISSILFPALHHKSPFSGSSSGSKVSCQDCSSFGHLEGVGQPYAAHM